MTSLPAGEGFFAGGKMRASRLSAGLGQGDGLFRCFFDASVVSVAVSIRIKGFLVVMGTFV
ncbi:MAG: hypothetical protein D6808_06190 [Candidatus Dadabacteria bacterium]|nr:MAG: hypothetical protein D6808_06190 [Candidatus Dadabacteria bacterium]